MIKKHIPNFITTLNLITGCLGILYAFTDQLDLSVYCIWLAMIFDFLDGFAARILKVSSPIGKELDSLADMVTFGVLPAFILFQLWLPVSNFFAYAAFLIAAFSALRLAKFNVDESQSNEFVGVPTPANAMFISSLVFVTIDYPALSNQNILLAITLVCSFWLVAPVRLIALKFKNFSISENKYRYMFLIGSLILIVVLKVTSIPAIIIYYVGLSVLKNSLHSNNI